MRRPGWMGHLGGILTRKKASKDLIDKISVDCRRLLCLVRRHLLIRPKSGGMPSAAANGDSDELKRNWAYNRKCGNSKRNHGYLPTDGYPRYLTCLPTYLGNLPYTYGLGVDDYRAPSIFLVISMVSDRPKDPGTCYYVTQQEAIVAM